MVKTKKVAMHTKCRELTNNDTGHTNVHRKASLDFWVREYRLLVYGRFHKTKMLKTQLGNRAPWRFILKL